MKKIYVVHGSDYDFENQLYTPLRSYSNFEFIFPHEKNNEVKNTIEIIKKCALVLAEVSYPSTGSGIELGRAESFGIPIVAIYKNGQAFSSSIRFVTENIIEYNDLKEDMDKILVAINNII